jgi:hypothetical protein
VYRSRVTSSTTDLNPGNDSATVRTRITAKKSTPKKSTPKKSPVKKGHAAQAGGKKHVPKRPHAGTPQSKRAGAK